MSFNQQSKDKMVANNPEDQDNEQGGAPLNELPLRPKSNLNPATAAYLPGKTTLQDLEATYQKVTQDPQGSFEGPIDLDPPSGMAHWEYLPDVPNGYSMPGFGADSMTTVSNQSVQNVRGTGDSAGPFLEGNPVISNQPMAAAQHLHMNPTMPPMAIHGFHQNMAQSYYDQIMHGAYGLPDAQGPQGPFWQPQGPFFHGHGHGHGIGNVGQPQQDHFNAHAGLNGGHQACNEMPGYPNGNNPFPSAAQYPVPGPLAAPPGAQPTVTTVSSFPPPLNFVEVFPAPRPQGTGNGYPEPSHCFTSSINDPGTDILRLDRRPVHHVRYTASAPNIGRAARGPESPQTPTPVRNSATPQLDQGYSDPYITTPARAGHSSDSTPRQLILAGDADASPSTVPPGAGSRTAAVVVRDSSVQEDHDQVTLAMTHCVDPKKPMIFKPESNPQRLYIKGMIYDLNVPPLPAAPVDPRIWSKRSEKLKELTGGPTGYPSLSTALDPDFFPFEPITDSRHRPDRGVIRIRNIPFNTKRCEVIALFGKNGRILNDIDEPVHIIMDRVSSKTNDVFVEFMTKQDAIKARDRFLQPKEGDRPTRLGDRIIVMELSTQAELMKELFPRAKNVIWQGEVPRIQPNRPDSKFGNFRGFVSEEEMIMLLKHVDTPCRAPFSKECPQRPYDCIISTIKKMPWCCPEGIAIKHRHSMYETTVSLIFRLADAIKYLQDPINLNKQLMTRLGNAAMRCPGFTVAQKDDIAYVLKMGDMDARAYNLPRFASSWRHFYGLRPKTNMPFDLIEWYVAIIREETLRLREKLPHTVRNSIQFSTEKETNSYFGDFWIEVWRAPGSDFENETIANTSERELMCIERVLRRALGP